jgi:methyl coenzyme M reductase subunit C
MTLDELCYSVRRTPVDLERWAELGALGDRMKEPRDRGKWRHITKDTAGRTIIMDRLVQAGLDEERAASIARTYVRRDHWPSDKIRTTVRGVQVVVDLAELELP